jgi:hypothetical protein
VVDDSLYDLLNVEKQAAEIVLEGEKEREHIRQLALDDANAVLRQFNARLPELHQSFFDKAAERAEQSIAELRLRYNERNKQLRELASEHEQEALNEAIRVLLNKET